jgi:hypothetical protein
MQRARTTSEAIPILKRRLEQGIANGSYMYVEVLKRCLKQVDLIAAKQIHDCIIKSRVEQNTFVANNLLSGYTEWMREIEGCAPSVWWTCEKEYFYLDHHDWRICMLSTIMLKMQWRFSIKCAMMVCSQMRLLTWTFWRHACASPWALR